jgi:hypothetical protein
MVCTASIGVDTDAIYPAQPYIQKTAKRITSMMTPVTLLDLMTVGEVRCGYSVVADGCCLSGVCTGWLLICPAVALDSAILRVKSKLYMK